MKLSLMVREHINKRNVGLSKEVRTHASAGAYRPMRVSSAGSARLLGSGRIVANRDRTPLSGLLPACQQFARNCAETSATKASPVPNK
jgi:hypothetical protein